MLAYHAYPFEEHQVVTEDGYILTLFRIPNGKNVNENEIGEGNENKNQTKKRRPVLIQHGLLTSSNDWLLQSSEEALPYILAEGENN